MAADCRRFSARFRNSKIFDNTNTFSAKFWPVFFGNCEVSGTQNSAVEVLAQGGWVGPLRVAPGE